MKILLALYYYHPYISGLSLLAKMEAEGLASRGHSVTVLTTKYDPVLPEDDTINGVRILRTNVMMKIGKGVLSVDFLRQLISLSKEHDIINPHLPMAHFGFVLPFIDRQKLVPQYHCDLNLGEGVLARVLESLSYWSMDKTLKKSSKIICTTIDYFSHCYFSQYIGKVCEVYPPIDQDKFHKKDDKTLKKKLDVQNYRYLIGFVGRIVEEKGIEYLLQAVPHLNDKVKNYKILLAGNYESVAGGSIKDKVDFLIDKYPGKIQFLGHLSFDELIRFYSMIDVLVLPSVDPLEAFGMVQVEAMLCETPVVATDMPGVREVVLKTGFGHLVKPRCSKEIAEKVLELIEHPLTIPREKLAEFDASISIDKYEKIFGEVFELQRS